MIETFSHHPDTDFKKNESLNYHKKASCGPIIMTISLRKEHAIDAWFAIWNFALSGWYNHFILDSI